MTKKRKPKPKPTAPVLADVTFTDASGRKCKRFRVITVASWVHEHVIWDRKLDKPLYNWVFHTRRAARDTHNILPAEHVNTKKFKLWEIEVTLDRGAA